MRFAGNVPLFRLCQCPSLVSGPGPGPGTHLSGLQCPELPRPHSASLRSSPLAAQHFCFDSFCFFLAFRRLCLFRADSSCQASRNLLSNHSKFEIPCLSQRLWLSPRPSRAPRQLLASGSRASFFSDVYPRRVLTVNPAACLQLPLQRPCFALQPSLHPVVSHGF